VVLSGEFSVRLPGHRIWGASSSSTDTVKLHELALPLASVAVQVTVCTPTAKVEPLAGSQTRLVTAQLSVALADQVTLVLPHWPASAVATRFVGQRTRGGSASRTVTVKVHELLFPEASIAVQVTVVVPMGNSLRSAGLQVNCGWPQLSLAPKGIGSALQTQL